MKKEERERERSISKLFNTTKYYIFCHNSIKMPYCVAAGAVTTLSERTEKRI